MCPSTIQGEDVNPVGTRALEVRELGGKPTAGEVPSPLNPPPGCRFHTRCPMAEDRCRVEESPIREIAPGHQAACHLI